MKKLMLAVVVCLFAALQVNAQGGLLKRVKQQADVVASAYGETWKTFYGNGYYKDLMVASLDVRPDGTPNIVLDEAKGSMIVTIRLSVNEPKYNAWKEAVHKRFKDANMSFTFSPFEDTEGRMIGGKNYRFGENEEASIRRWESVPGNQYKAKLTVYIALVDKFGNVIREEFVPIDRFERLGFKSYPLPLHNLNRLRDLPVSRFHWFDTEKEPTADNNVESSYLKMRYDNLAAEEMGALEDVKCVVLDEDSKYDFRKSMIKRGSVFKIRACNGGVEVVGLLDSVSDDVSEISIPATVSGQKVIGIAQKAFVCCNGIKKITIADGISYIGNSAFADCSGLTSITMPKSVKSIGWGAFRNCSGLKSVTIGNGVTSIGEWAFEGCDELKSVTIPSSVTSIGNGAFSDCSGLEDVYVNSGDEKRISVLLKDAVDDIDGLEFEEIQK